MWRLPWFTKYMVHKILITGILPVLLIGLSAFVLAGASHYVSVASATELTLPQTEAHDAERLTDAAQVGSDVAFRPAAADGMSPGNAQGTGPMGDETGSIQARANNSSAPYIVSGGVKMYDVKNATEASGWPYRAPGDDTYGNGELIVVSVEFSEPVRVNGETTFRINIGSSVRDLAPVSRRDETILFGSLIRSYDRDTDGVWIGDNTATLGHNPANYIQSNPDEGDPVNVNLTHSSVGTQSNHKVNGRAYRPKVTDIRIVSTPQYGDTYVRNETVKIEARFDRPVRTSGLVSVRINSESLGSDALRFALYAEGSGTSRLVFNHIPGFAEIDPDGIAIPGNALAKNGDVTQGVSGGGKIVGRSGGLRAHLNSRGKGENSNHKIDVRLAGVPEIIALANWDWEEDSPPSDSVEVDFRINEDPGHFSEDHSLVVALGLTYIDGELFGFALRTDVDNPDTDGSEGKGIAFNRWGTSDTENFSRTTGDGWTVAGNILGPFVSIRRSFDWGQGNYSVRIAPDGDDEDTDNDGTTDVRWYGMWITDKSTGVTTHMGSLKYAYEGGTPPTMRAHSQGFSSLIVMTGDGPINTTAIPVIEVAVGLPDAAGGPEPNAATVNYAQLGRGIINANVSYNEDTGKLIMRAGGSTRISTTAGTTLTGLETPPLTASFLRIPRSHDGSREFVFRLQFSEEIPLSYKTLRDHAFDVEGGSVVKASRVYTSSNMQWEIRIRPDSNADVTVTLPATQNCWDAGGICTADGRELSGPTEATIPGPSNGN